MTPMIEIIFNLIYLVTGLVFSLFLVAKSKKRFSYIVIALLGLSISFGEGLHLIPKMLNSLGVPVQDLYSFFGVGQFAISFVMTLLFVFFYWIYKIKYQNKVTPILDLAIYSLAIFKIVMSLVDDSFLTNNISMSLLRNAPYIVMAGLLLYIGYFWTKRKDELIVKYLYIYLSISIAAFILYSETAQEVKQNFKILPVMIVLALVGTITYFFWSSVQANKSIKKLE